MYGVGARRMEWELSFISKDEHLVDGLLVAVADDLLDAVDVLAVAVDLVPPGDEAMAAATERRSGRRDR